MALSEPVPVDAHVHTHHADRAQKTGKRPPEGPKTARAGATRARVIPLRPDLRQEVRPDHVPPARRPAGGGLEGEAQAALGAVTEAMEGSDWAQPPVTVLSAARAVFPARKEAPGAVAWVAMSAAGAFGLFLVALGHLIAQAGHGRVRPAVTALVAALALIISFVAAHAA